MTASLPDCTSSATRWYSPRGRAGRMEFWCWLMGLPVMVTVVLFLLTVGGVVAGFACAGRASGYITALLTVYSVVVAGVCLLPFFLMLCRRLRDAGLKPRWSWDFLALLLVNLGLGVYLIFPPVISALHEALPITEQIDAEKIRLHREYPEDDNARRRALADLKLREQQELSRMVQQVSGRAWEHQQTALFCLEILTKSNVILLCLLLIPGFLPTRLNTSEQTPNSSS